MMKYSIELTLEEKARLISVLDEQIKRIDQDIPDWLSDEEKKTIQQLQNEQSQPYRKLLKKISETRPC